MNIMKKLTIALPIILIVSTVSCSTPDHKRSIPSADLAVFSDIDSLTLYDSVSINDVFDVSNWSLSDDRLKIHQRGNKSIIKIYHWPDGDFMFGGLDQGEGPDEFYVVNPADASDKNEMLMYDIMKRHTMTYNVGGDTISPGVAYKLPLDQDSMALPYTYISQISDSVFLMKMDSDNKSSWQLVDLKSQKQLWEYDNELRDSLKSYTPFDFIQSVNGSTLVAAYRYMDLVEFYNFSLTEGLTHANSYGKYADLSEIDNYNNLRNYSLSAFSYDGRCYILKSGDSGEFGNIVEIYDLSDRLPKKKVYLDRHIVSINHDSEGNLIGYAPKNESSVFYIWKLPN